LIRRYRGKERSSAFEKLANIEQKGSVEDYIQEFEVLVSLTLNFPNDQLMGYFLVR